MKKNVASQTVGSQMVSAADGSAFTGSVTVYVTGDAGTQAAGSVGSGACTHEGNGFHSYRPSQAETNYDHVAFTFTGTGAIPSTVQVYPSFPQTGDAYARIGAAVGSPTQTLSEDIASLPSAAGIASAVWLSVVEGSHTAVQLMRGFAAVLLGKASGMATSTATFRDIDDSKTRVTATVDADGNRTSVTTDLT